LKRGVGYFMGGVSRRDAGGNTSNTQMETSKETWGKPF